MAGIPISPQFGNQHFLLLIRIRIARTLLSLKPGFSHNLQQTQSEPLGAGGCSSESHCYCFHYCSHCLSVGSCPRKLRFIELLIFSFTYYPPTQLLPIQMHQIKPRVHNEWDPKLETALPQITMLPLFKCSSFCPSHNDKVC